MPDATEAPLFYQKPLYRLLDLSFPQFRTKQGLLNVPELAEAIKMSGEGVYKWIRADKLTPDGAKKLAALGKDASTLKIEDLYPFVMR